MNRSIFNPELQEYEEVSIETLLELSNGKGEDEDE